jgi:hypothetical protein
MRLLTVVNAANFIVVAFASISAWPAVFCEANVGTMGVFIIDAQLPPLTL